MHDTKVEQLKNRLKAMERSVGTEEAQSHLPQQEVDQHFARLNYEVEQINRNWHVSPEYEITSHRRWIGKWIVFGKKVIRKLLRWYINPAFDKQRSFNANVTRSLYALSAIANRILAESNEKTTYLEQRILELGEKNAEESRRMEERVEERLEEIQRTLVEKFEDKLNELESDIKMRMDHIQEQVDQLSHVVYLNTSAGRMNALDYLSFEQKFRGTREVIKERQKFYLPFFLNRENVLDIGCGRGEFIELLREHGVRVKGIDVNQDMVDFCKSQGFDVEYIDATVYLSELEEESLDGVFMAQVVEHLPTESLLELISLVYKALRPGGVFVVETINVQSVFAMSNWFYMDPTHVKPVHPETLRFLLQEYGFNKVDLEFLSPVEDRKIEQLHIEGADTSQFNQSMQQLQNLIYGNQDYAAVAYK